MFEKANRAQEDVKVELCVPAMTEVFLSYTGIPYSYSILILPVRAKGEAIVQAWPKKAS